MQTQKTSGSETNRPAQRIHIDPVHEAQISLQRAQQNYQNVLQGVPASWPGLVTGHGLNAMYGSAWPIQSAPHAWPAGTATPGGFALALPSCELFDDGGELVCRIDLPGVKAESIELQCSENSLWVRATREWDAPANESGRATAAFPTHQRNLPLPSQVRPEAVKAALRDGVLTVSMPKSHPAPATRRIEIQS